MSQLARELKQARPFRSPVQEAMLGIWRTAALLELRMAEVLRPFALTPTQYNVLRILHGAGDEGLPRCEVQARLVAPVADTTRLLDRLVRQGLVTRLRSDEDRRIVTSRITPRGRAVLDRAGPALRELEASEMGRIPAARLQALIKTLDEVRRLTPIRRT